MKRTAIILLALLVVFPVVALTQTYAITLVSVVPPVPSRYAIAYQGQVSDRLTLRDSLVGNDLDLDFSLIKTEGNVPVSLTLSASAFYGDDGLRLTTDPVISLDGNRIARAVSLASEERAYIPFSIHWDITSNAIGTAIVSVSLVSK
jgi:hypothetical protein